MRCSFLNDSFKAFHQLCRHAATIVFMCTSALCVIGHKTCGLHHFCSSLCKSLVPLWAADDWAAANLRPECQILDSSCTDTLTEGRLESHVCWGQISDKQGLFTTGSWARSGLVPLEWHHGAQLRPSPTAHALPLFIKYHFGPVYGRGGCWSSSLLSVPVYTYLKCQGIM